MDIQWLVLVSGKGTRIDPSGKLNKITDIYFYGKSALQWVRDNLTDAYPHIIVINNLIAEKVARTFPEEGVVTDFFEQDPFGKNAMVNVMSIPKHYGTGAAILSAEEVIRNSEAEHIGLAFGDEPFLTKDIYEQTVQSHEQTQADVTLCGKFPEKVVDKGVLLFDKENKFIGTKEWFDLTEEEQEQAIEQHKQRNTYTNTGLMIIKKDLLLKYLPKMQPHKNDEYHYVDIIRFCYEDNLKTNAFIYKGEIISGINRWINVFIGQQVLYERKKKSSSIQNYTPGVYTFGEQPEEDYKKLLHHVEHHTCNEIIPRAIKNKDIQALMKDSIQQYLKQKEHIDHLTPEELWSIIFLTVQQVEKNDPYQKEKQAARATANKLIENTAINLKTVIAANIIDYSSNTVLKKVRENSNYFQEIISKANETDLAIDNSNQFNEMITNTEGKSILYLTDNDGEAVFDLLLCNELAKKHTITIAGKASPASNDATQKDLEESKEQLEQEGKIDQHLNIISSGSTTVGTNLFEATPAFQEAREKADIIISKGQGNFYTTQQLEKDRFYLLLSKGVTAERTTGIKNDGINSMICAFVPKGKEITTLKEICA